MAHFQILYRWNWRLSLKANMLNINFHRNRWAFTSLATTNESINRERERESQAKTFIQTANGNHNISHLVQMSKGQERGQQSPGNHQNLDAPLLLRQSRSGQRSQDHCLPWGVTHWVTWCSDCRSKVSLWLRGYHRSKESWNLGFGNIKPYGTTMISIPL